MLVAFNKLLNPLPTLMEVMPCSVTAFVTVRVPRPDRPGDKVEPELAVTLPFTVPIPSNVCKLAKVRVLSVRPPTSKIAPEASAMGELLEIEPLFVSTRTAPLPLLVRSVGPEYVLVAV